MGFLDGLMGDAVKGLGKIALKKGMESATEHAVDAAVGYTVGSAAKSLANRGRSPLQAAPPPPVPVMNQKAMRVMVAVNGQTYGPYERVTLEEMVANGALTSETFVFMEGMANWAPAASVACVAELLSNRAPAPAAPPVPWANVPAAPGAPAAPQAAPAQEDNGFSPKLNALITSAVADGEISDLERQVLIRNAQNEGVSMDEFVMVLEARLYERQQELLEMRAEKERKDKAAQAQVTAASASVAAAAAAAATPKPAAGKPTKCPHCGAPIKPLATTCPQCGNDYGEIASNDSSAWDRLQAKMAEAEAENAKRSFWQDKLRIDDIIMQFPVPNTKVEMFDFFSYCAPMARASYSSYKEAFKNKSQQILSKAHILFKDDPAMLEKFDTIAKQNKIKLKN